ncbi:MAG: hypothetical protein ACE5HL_03130 [Terriglobia bacterium]
MRMLLPILLLLSLPLAAPAQQRPLTTEEAETVPAGETLVQFGFEYLQDVRFPLSGLEGDLSRVGVLDVRMGISRAAEIEIQGTIRNFLSVSEQGAAFVALAPGQRPALSLSRGATSTSDFGDFTLAAKFRLRAETERHPAIGLRFGFEMPNSDEARGIGLNTTNIFATLLAQKHFGKLNLFGNLGLGIFEAPAGSFSQNDLILYGLGAVYPVHARVNLVGEVAGRQSTRSTPVSSALVGTGSRSQARLGVQVFAGGFRWDFAGIAGLTKNDANTGFAFGVSKSLRLWSASGTTR